MHSFSVLGVLALLGATMVVLKSEPTTPPATIVRVVPMPVPIETRSVDAEPDPVEARATAPFLRALCIDHAFDQNAETEEQVACDWNDGFPAISADGKTVVVKHDPGTDPHGYPGLDLLFVDVATSAIRERLRIQHPSDYPPDDEAKDKARVERRVQAVQGKLAGYRSLVRLGYDKPPALQVQTEGDSMRIVDPTTATAIWQGEFPASTYGNVKLEGHCDTVESSFKWVWWDAPTRTIAIDATYVFGGEECGGDSKWFVQRAK